MSIIVFLSSGLFLGWSLGANDAANVFGTAVGSRMLRFRTAAIICSVFVILGAALSGSGAAHTLGKLGAVNEIAGAFMVALAAALTVYWMTKLELPVSTSQAIVGAIIGWNYFSGSLTDTGSLTKIVSTWVICPLLSGVFSFLLYRLTRWAFGRVNVHLLKLDHYTRIGLVVAGAFGAYSLGANNIANVMGVFVPVSPFRPLDIGLLSLSNTDQLFILGGLAIAVGVFTYSHKVMGTVGTGILHLTPQAAFVVVVASGLVLFLFASQGLEAFLASHGFPTIPLVPVSSSQAVVGAVLGIGLAQGGRGINYRTLGKIASGWVTTPIIAAVVSFVALFFLQNVFNQKVYRPVVYQITASVQQKLSTKGGFPAGLRALKGARYESAVAFIDALEQKMPSLSRAQRERIASLAMLEPLVVDLSRLEREIQDGWLSKAQLVVLRGLDGQRYQHDWELGYALAQAHQCWRPRPSSVGNSFHNKALKTRLKHLVQVFGKR
ncbi:MAG: inorganic phosphate transporter [Deltaproteobacteria bacterium]|nr:inorganic phosphate transporter [Deltaproteobacteria bacterium]